jgi:hypothetical protein
MTACAAKLWSSALLVAERTDLLAKSGDKAEQRVPLAQWHRKQCADAPSLREALNPRQQARIRLGVRNVDQWLATYEPGRQTPLGRPRRGGPQLLHRFDKTRLSLDRRKAELFPRADPQNTVCSATEGVCLIQDRIEYRRKVAG